MPHAPHPAFARLVAMALVAAAPFAAPAPAAAETLQVTVVAGHPPVFRWVRIAREVFIPSVDLALEGTGHAIAWSEQYGGALAGVGGELEAVEAGLSELGLVSSLFSPSKLPLQNVTYVTPFVSSDSTLVSMIMDRLQRTDPTMQAAWEENGLEYLGCAIGIDDYLLMTSFPVNEIADLEGRKIGAPGAAVNWLQGTGAVGVSGNLTTYYNDIRAGVYDGVITFASAALPGKLHEVAPYITRVGFGAQYAGGMAANKEWFDAAPVEVQEALIGGCAAYSNAYHADLDAFVDMALFAMAEAGATVTEATPAMRAAWAAGMDNTAALWAADLDARGQQGSEALSRYMAAMREAGATPARDWDLE